VLRCTALACSTRSCRRGVCLCEAAAESEAAAWLFVQDKGRSATPQEVAITLGSTTPQAMHLPGEESRRQQRALCATGRGTHRMVSSTAAHFVWLHSCMRRVLGRSGPQPARRGCTEDHMCPTRKGSQLHRPLLGGAVPLCKCVILSAQGTQGRFHRCCSNWRPTVCH
jgi:hypothetical protein